jgi:hypothetical protein
MAGPLGRCRNNAKPCCLQSALGTVRVHVKLASEALYASVRGAGSLRPTSSTRALHPRISLSSRACLRESRARRSCAPRDRVSGQRPYSWGFGQSAASALQCGTGRRRGTSPQLRASDSTRSRARCADRIPDRSAVRLGAPGVTLLVSILEFEMTVSMASSSTYLVQRSVAKDIDVVEAGSELANV